MKLTTTTTYIKRNGEVVETRKKEDVLYFEVATPNIRQMAVIKEFNSGYKITVTKIEPDEV